MQAVAAVVVLVFKVVVVMSCLLLLVVATGRLVDKVDIGFVATTGLPVTTKLLVVTTTGRWAAMHSKTVTNKAIDHLILSTALPYLD